MNTPTSPLRNLFSPIEVKSALLVGLFSFLIASVVALIGGQFTFQLMMKSLENQMNALHTSVENHLDLLTFSQIHSEEDIESELYQKGHQLLLQLKESSGAQYLYTVKRADQINFVYLIDALNPLSSEFRNPGDPIEEEHALDILSALNDQPVISSQPIHAEWGDIFLAYLPVHDQYGDVIGAVGIEFSANDLYHIYETLQRLMPVVILLFVALSILLSHRLFLRIYNPLDHNTSTQDTITDLKNRRTYENDLSILINRKRSKGIGIVVVDINGIKEVNDRLGHPSGDNYIKLVANALSDRKEPNMVVYRTGGDEFIILAQETTEENLSHYVIDVTNTVKNQTDFSDMRCSISCGHAFFHPEKDIDLKDTYHRADNTMYEEKRRQKKKMER